MQTPDQKRRESLKAPRRDVRKLSLRLRRDAKTFESLRPGCASTLNEQRAFYGSSDKEQNIAFLQRNARARTLENAESIRFFVESKSSYLYINSRHRR